jgi:hypothetical protein
VRRWFAAHAFTTNAITSVLVLLVTVLIVDRVLAARRQRERRVVTAAQAAILSRQARRTLELVTAALDDPARRGSAADELRTYMAMLLVSAPVLIEAPASRVFLEAAQRLAGLLSDTLEHASGRAQAEKRLQAAAHTMRTASAPLLQALDRSQLRAVDEEEGVAGEGAQAPVGT